MFGGGRGGEEMMGLKNVHFSFFCLQPPHLRVKKIFVGGLKPETTDQQIRNYFSASYAMVSIVCHNSTTIP